ncbi:unnamed protein product [Cylindrotheca closterium]|uniref:Uncharacterized protein n=1 Tax=Cylindrotheca closterium TaxID=2856 RepID=A0AAD2FM62_9STRA|nr:unnamed protein product [Cylindrotheca closterium]
MHSDHFSRLLDKIVVAVGADKDELATSMLLRILNRIMGNCSDYVTTLAMYENAAECYGNMENFFSKADFKAVTSPQDFQNFQNFENESEQDIYASSTWNEKDDNNNGNEEQSISTVSTFPNGEITDECQGKEYGLDDATSITDDDDKDENSSDEFDGLTEEEEDMEGYNLNHHDRARTDDEEQFFSNGEVEGPSLEMGCIRLKLDNEWENGSNRLGLQLVYDDDNKYYGFRIFLNNADVDGDGQQDKVLVAGLFEKPIQRREPNDELIDCGLKQVIGFVSCDKKNSWATMGMMDSASARSNCIFCTQPKSTYKTNFPDWMVQYAKEHGLENERLAAKVEAGWKDYLWRCGEHSNSIMFQKLEEDTNNGNNTYSEDELRDI